MNVPKEKEKEKEKEKGHMERSMTTPAGIQPVVGGGHIPRCANIEPDVEG